MHRRFLLLLLSVLLPAGASSVAAQELKVGITPELGWLDVVHAGKRVRIQRIQDTNNRLQDTWARTSRPCPPDCIQPMVAAEGVQTVGEIELLDFLAGKGRSGQGLMIDARPPEAYRVETIPTAINLPFSIIRPDNPHLFDVLRALGAQRRGEAWDFASARDLAVFCAGAWSDQARLAIEALASMGYPASKLKYYRGGMQSWRAFGLTTVITDASR